MVGISNPRRYNSRRSRSCSRRGLNVVAFLELDEASGRFRIRFDYGGREFKRSVKTRDEGVAQGILRRVEDIIWLLEQGRLEMPPDAEPGHFILSDGRRNDKPLVQKPLTLDDLFTLYRKALPEGAKEANTITTERLHCKHFLRILGAQTVAQALGLTDLQR